MEVFDVHERDNATSVANDNDAAIKFGIGNSGIRILVMGRRISEVETSKLLTGRNSGITMKVVPGFEMSRIAIFGNIDIFCANLGKEAAHGNDKLTASDFRAAVCRRQTKKILKKR